ncbi:MAG: single-stranded DNA-binding protein [Epsilonproteobacteria bacterium]|nr:single-stranded DNA-binding protein [Campylobacterota bacterium]
MAGYNRIVMVGNLTRDPELKQLPSGQSVCRLGLASNRQFKNRQTNMQVQEVCYVDVDVWGAQADSCQKFLAKGRAVLVEGRLKFDSWQDPQGATRSKHSITADRVVFLSNANADAEEESDTQSNSDASEKVSFGTQNTEKFAKVEQEIAQKKAAAQKVESSKTTAAKKSKNEAVDGLPEFKDEAPFEDDLPF